ncbi:MAG: hypothetical protein ABF270_01845, partial [Flavobacteriales bacterium]
MSCQENRVYSQTANLLRNGTSSIGKMKRKLNLYMAKSQETYNKKEKEKKRLKKRQEKEARKLARKEEEKNSGLDSMMAYVDEFGNITDTPPDPTKKKVEIDAEDIVIGVPTREAMPEPDPIRQG